MENVEITDDMAVITDTELNLQRNVNELKEELEKANMKINTL